MVMKIPVSFAQNEKDIYDYAKSKRSPSIYIKDLIEADMKKSVKNSSSYKSEVLENRSSDFEIDI